MAPLIASIRSMAKTFHHRNSAPADFLQQRPDRIIRITLMEKCGRELPRSLDKRTTSARQEYRVPKNRSTGRKCRGRVRTASAVRNLDSVTADVLNRSRHCLEDLQDN